MNDLQTKQDIEAALAVFDTRPFAEAATGLFESLGYKSDKRLRLSPNTREQFLATFGLGKTLNEKSALTAEWKSVDFLFQLTDDEIHAAGPQQILFDSKGTYNGSVMESYLFLALELKDAYYTRGVIAGMTRELNKLFAMPALVLFRHGNTLTFAIINRRLHKRDQSHDVLEKVTLVKDIAFADPIRAHLEILNDCTLASLDADFGVSNFVALHSAWQKRLGTYALSSDFYREIADWYFWAHHQVDAGIIRLPQDCDTKEEKSLFLIRLLTRIIFCWFLVEKRLLPSDFFRDLPLRKLLKDLAPESESYYHAVLQNLFFGTLNMPAEQRGFREKKKEGQRYDKNFGITNLWRYEADFRDSSDWVQLASRVPFLNGGLFDCLDDKTGKKTENFVLDGFSDNPRLACHLPNDLFFGSERTVDLSSDYGDEGSHTARSKKSRVRGLIEILSRYKFTIEENTPLEEEIALDPELLGKVFENLLASYNEDTGTIARKALGAFYTPREIVSYIVDEALKSYLATQVPRVKGLLDELFSNRATPRDIKPEQRDALIVAIGRVRILDPACGSGAFPMGALHRLVDLLQKLDPNNESWKRDRLAEAYRYRALLEETGAPREEVVACEARIADIEKSFDTRFHALDFARKLYLIENAIFGVDIQPVAVQIAKLRFFIALVVDQRVDPREANLGVRPLPNLETRLVAADSLIPIEKAERDLFSDEIDNLRSELARIRHEHFNARDPRNKRKWREADAAKRQQIADLLERDQSIPREAARKLAIWDPYDQNTSARFFDSEWMFGLPVGKVRVEGKPSATILGHLALINEVSGQTELTTGAIKEVDSGFDIVIGNPPYIRIQTLKKKDPQLVAFYKGQYVSAAKGNYDLYVVFIEAGLRFLKPDGHLAYICPHKFFNAQYGEPLRKMIAEGRHLRHVVHFGDEQVFPGAAIYTCLLFLAKEGSADCRFVMAHDLEAWKATFAGAEGKFPSSTITAADWTFAVGKGADFFHQLDAMPIKLGALTTHIAQGIRTSANEVYVLDVVSQKDGLATAYSKQLGSNVEIESDLLLKFLQGKEIKPFVVLPSGKVVIVPYRLESGRSRLIGYSEITKKFPYLARYLKSARKVLEQREQGRMVGDHWHAYIYPKNIEVMKSPKLLVPDIADHASFAIDEKGDFAFTSGYGILVKDATTTPLKFLLALCNSHILDFYWRRISTPLRGGFFRYFTQFIEQFPIADSTAAQRACLVNITDSLLYLNRHFADHPTDQTTRDPLMLAYFQQILNGLVYELYFSAEVHGAALSLFGEMERATLPTIDSVPERRRLPKMRQLFETLYDGSHPLRIGLQRLQTLDVVRVIEGRT